ncbi:MAG: hypothetical protein FVQ83_01280 [Chloroflexi bacterium]|nr:hypothetical protein [Chloroflexota bacterium]
MFYGGGFVIGILTLLISSITFNNFNSFFGIVCFIFLIFSLAGILATLTNNNRNDYGNKVDFLLKDVPPGNFDEELRVLVQNGKKIEAIKRLRQTTKMGLKEAKDYVENL